MFRRKQARTVEERRQQALDCFSHGVTHLVVAFPYDEAVRIAASAAICLKDDEAMADLARKAGSTVDEHLYIARASESIKR